MAKYNPRAMFLQLTDERGRKCEKCGTSAGLDLPHHCLFHRSGKFPEFNTKYNLEILCHSCHDRANSYDHRCDFWARQYERYGEELVDWYEGIEMRGTKERFW